jgi:hypothetical protein
MNESSNTYPQLLGESVVIVDMTELKHNYLQNAPAILRNYIDFCDYITIIANSEPTPSYSEFVMESITHILDKKRVSLDDEDFETTGFYNDRYVIYLDTYLNNILINFNIASSNEYERYVIQNWISPKTAVISWC